jgi:hypothetical protein
MDWTDNEGKRPMVSDSGVAESLTYKKYIGNSGKVWMVAVQDNPADNIYVSGGKHSEGMAGRTLAFKLEDGTTEEIQGPWHANANALFKDTGVDVRDMCSTFGVIGFDRQYGSHGMHPVTIIDVQYKDEHWTLGSFDRIEKIAQGIANRKDRTVYYFVKSKGGSSCGPVKPEKISNKG